MRGAPSRQTTAPACVSSRFDNQANDSCTFTSLESTCDLDLAKPYPPQSVAIEKQHSGR
jgi:hypothetical protein